MIAHCILVVIAMYAVGALRVRERTAPVVLGFLGFIVFAFTELLRTSLVIFAVNRTWRENYVNAADEGSRQTMRTGSRPFRESARGCSSCSSWRSCWGRSVTASPLQWMGPYFQPAARAVIGVWLWKRAAFYGRAVPGAPVPAEGIRTRLS